MGILQEKNPERISQKQKFKLNGAVEKIAQREVSHQNDEGLN
jgi:hypothetical protein